MVREVLSTTKDLEMHVDFYEDERIKALPNSDLGIRCTLLFMILSGLAIKRSDEHIVLRKDGGFHTVKSLTEEFPDIKNIIRKGIPVLKNVGLIEVIDGKMYVRCETLLR